MVKGQGLLRSHAMRQTRHSAGLAGLSTEYSLAQALLVALGASLAVVAGALAVMYPALTALVVGAAAVSWFVAAVALRVRLTRRPVRRVLMVRVPYTDLHLEV